MAYFRCGTGGDSGEVHGATVLVTVNTDTWIGQVVRLEQSDGTLVDSKIVGSGLSVVFENIQQPDVYVAKLTFEGNTFNKEVEVDADAIVNKKVILAELSSFFMLYDNGDEFTDTTGGWEILEGRTTEITKTTSGIVFKGVNYQCGIATRVKFPISVLREYKRFGYEFTGISGTVNPGTQREIRVGFSHYTFPFQDAYKVVAKSSTDYDPKVTILNKDGFDIPATFFSAIEGYGFTDVCIAVSSRTINGTLKKLWLEK